MIKLGSGNVTLYLGDKKVTAAWLGTEKVYPNSFLELSASSLSFAAAGQTQQLAITVNDGQAWTIAALPAGFSVSASSGTGPATVTVTAANNTSITARTGTLTVNSEDLSAACSLSQTAGAKVYGAWQNVRLETEGNITSFAAGGGTAKIHMVVERTWTWNGVAGSGGSETNWAQPADVTVSDTIASVSADVLTVGSLGTTFKAATQILIGAGTASDTVSTNRKTLAITQAANYVTSVNSLKTRTLTYSQIGAGGGTSDCQWDSYLGTAINTLWSCTFASGATGTATDADAVGNFRQIGIGYSWTGPSGTITSLNETTGAITATSRGTTVGNAITVTVNAIQSVVFDNPSSVGGSTTPVLYQPVIGTCSQAANAVTKYGIPSGRQLSVPTIPASGGTVSKGTWSGTIKQSRTFTSGASDTLTNPTVTAERWSSPVSAGKIGAVDKPATPVGSITGYYTCNGVEVSVGVTVTQAANYIDTSKTKTTCNGTTATRTFTYVSGATKTETETNSYYCGYRVRYTINLNVMQSGIMVAPVFKTVQAWSCRTNNVSGQGSSTVTFSNPKFGGNTATLELSESEKSYKYVLIQCPVTYTDSGGTGAIPNYSWSGVVTSSGSLAICSVSNNSVSASLSVSAAAKSLSVQEDAAKMLEQIESGELKVSDEIVAQLQALAQNAEA